MCRVTVGLEQGEHRRCGVPIGFGQLSRPSAKPLEEDVAVPHVAEDAGQPPELAPKRRHELVVEEERNVRKSERSRPRGDTRLVHALGIGVEPHDRVVSDEPDRRQRKRRCTAPPALASAPRSLTAISGVSGTSAPSARMYFAVLSGGPAPAWRRRSTRASRRPGVVSSPISTSTSRNADRAPSPFSTETASSTTPARSLPFTSWTSVRRRIVVIRTRSCSSSPRTKPRTSATAWAGGLLPLPSKTISGRTRSARRALRAASPSSPRRAGGGGLRPTARGEDRRCRSTSCRSLGGRLPHRRADEPVDARHAEVGRRGELQLALGLCSTVVSAYRRPGAGTVYSPRATVSEPEQSGCSDCEAGREPHRGPRTPP